ncbi:MAG: PEP/pyruvate-binding domain-containing protein [Anaerolineaceae bacterium]
MINSDYEPLRFIAQLDEDGYFASLRSMLVDGENQKLVLTFDDLLKRTNFAERMREMLRLLEFNYRSPVDMEFALHINMDQNRQADVCITILQCRPQSRLQATEQVSLPTNLLPEETIFTTHFMVPQGCVRGIDYVLFVKPETYLALPDHAARSLVARTVGHLNAALAEKEFVCVGPGRWGSSNSDLGVPIDYGDIYHSRSLIELAGQGYGLPPEPSLGTHFFQDLMEAQIYPLAIFLDDTHNQFNRTFFYDSPNHIREFIPVDDAMADCLRLIQVSDYRPSCEMQIVMNEEKSTAIAYVLKKSDSPDI